MLQKEPLMAERRRRVVGHPGPGASCAPQGPLPLSPIALLPMRNPADPLLRDRCWWRLEPKDRAEPELRAAESSEVPRGCVGVEAQSATSDLWWEEGEWEGTRHWTRGPQSTLLSPCQPGGPTTTDWADTAPGVLYSGLLHCLLLLDPAEDWAGPGTPLGGSEVSGSGQTIGGIRCLILASDELCEAPGCKPQRCLEV
ncbi:hypothetical protein NDU88_001769 [Pleurodeles waltl]|uniref:Uncharacterized protein n=1 Tax=Pleurodeles waltl TaxID=8319 RepID=A0AAV7VCF7_PLEWA|nr:hypothetical protein NDU88_001769 [Pleurodeles waltl]